MSEKTRATWPKVVIAVPLLLIILYVLLADSVIKSTLESQLGNAHGAEVNIGEFDHSLFPLSISLANVQMTNANKPSHNQLTISQIDGDVEWGPLLSGEVVVNELNLLGIKMDAQRNEPGAVYRQPTDKFGANQFGFPSKEDLPDLDTLLERSPLKTTAAVQQAQQAYQTHYEGLQAQYDALPNKDDLALYKQEIEAIKSLPRDDPAAIAQAASQLKALKEKMSADKQKVSAFLADAKAARAALSESSKQIKAASKADYEEMSLLLAGDEAAFARVTETVFGEEFAQYAEYITMAMQIVLPMLQGESAAQPEEPAGPPTFVLVKNANVSIDWQGNEWLSEWKDITTIHERLGRPTTFSLDGEHAGQVIKTAGEFFIGEDGVNGKQQWDVQNLLMQAVQLVNSEQLGALIESARISSAGSLSINDNQLKGGSDINMSALKLSANSSSDMGNVVAKALNSLSALTLNADVSGDLMAPDLSFSSDLDTQIAKNLAGQLTGAGGEQNPVLAEKLAALTNTSTEQMESGLGQIGQWLSAAEGDGATLDNLLATQANSLVEEGKNKLLDKLKKKLGQ